MIPDGFLGRYPESRTRSLMHPRLCFKTPSITDFRDGDVSNALAPRDDSAPVLVRAAERTTGTRATQLSRDETRTFARRPCRPSALYPLTTRVERFTSSRIPNGRIVRPRPVAAERNRRHVGVCLVTVYHAVADRQMRRVIVIVAAQ